VTDLERYAAERGLDLERFLDDLCERVHPPRTADDVDSANMSGVTGTPSFFVNGRRHDSGYDLTTLSRLVGEALNADPDRLVGR
jgi:protein-disulfide isomerase